MLFGSERLNDRVKDQAMKHLLKEKLTDSQSAISALFSCSERLAQSAKQDCQRKSLHSKSSAIGVADSQVYGRRVRIGQTNTANRTLDLNESVARVRDLVLQAFGEQCCFQMSLEKSPCIIAGRSELVEQLLVHLAIHIGSHTTGDLRYTVTTKRTSFDRSLRPTTWNEPESMIQLVFAAENTATVHPAECDSNAAIGALQARASQIESITNLVYRCGATIRTEFEAQQTVISIYFPELHNDPEQPQPDLVIPFQPS